MNGSESQVWLITGTSSGFGRRLVSSALARGDRVIATARDTDKVKGLPGSDNLRLLQLDVTDCDDVIKARIDEALAVWGRIDVLVNNAGIGLGGLIEEGGIQRFKEQFNTNVFGVLNVTNAVLPHLRERRSGTVVILGSRSAWKTDIPGLAPYCSSKAAIHAIGETLAAEVAQFSIRVLIVAPGSFRTEGIYGNPFFMSNPIMDYDTLRHASAKRFHSVSGTEKGDPVKAAEAIVDVVRGEGMAEGKEWPMYLILGHDCEDAVKTKCAKVLAALDEWKDVTRAMNFDV